MKLLPTILGVLAFVASADSLLAQQPTEFPIGVFTFGGNDVDYTQMKDTLGLTWVQRWGGSHGHASDFENNPKGLRILTECSDLEDNDVSSLEGDPDWLKRFQSSPRPDTILYLDNATIYFYDKDIGRLKTLGILP